MPVREIRLHLPAGGNDRHMADNHVRRQSGDAGGPAVIFNRPVGHPEVAQLLGRPVELAAAFAAKGGEVAALGWHGDQVYARNHPELDVCSDLHHLPPRRSPEHDPHVRARDPKIGRERVDHRVVGPSLVRRGCDGDAEPAVRERLDACPPRAGNHPDRYSHRGTGATGSRRRNAGSGCADMPEPGAGRAGPGNPGKSVL